MAEQTITIPHVRQESDVTLDARLKDNGVAVDWTSLSDVKAYIYSDTQRVIAGKCTVEVDGSDSEQLNVTYAATSPQYLGQNSLLIRCTYQGRQKSFDVPCLVFVERTAQATGVEVLTDPEIPVELEVEDVSTSLLDGAIAAALDAAVEAEEAKSRADAAAEAAEAAAQHGPMIGGNGNWFLWDFETGAYVDTGVSAGGGGAANAVQYVPQSLTSGQKEQARTNIGAGTYSKPSGGIPASDLAQGVIPTALSQLADDSTHRLVTDSEKAKWNETNIIHSRTMMFPSPFTGYTAEQAAEAFGVTAEEFSLIRISTGIYRTMMGGMTTLYYQGTFIMDWRDNGVYYRRLSYDTVMQTYSFSDTLTSQADWNESDNALASFIKNKPDLNMKADKVLSPTAGNFAGLDSNGNLTDSGKKASDFLTSHQDISGKEDKSNKVTSFGSTPSDTKYPSEKLVKDSLDAKQPTIDASHKLDYSLLSNTPTIPDAQIQSDWSQSDNTKKDYIKNKPTIPTVPVTDVTVGGTSVVSNGTAAVPAIPAAVEANPTVPSGTPPTDLAGLKVGNNYYGIPQLPTVDNTPTANSNNLVKSGGVYSEVHPAVASSQPAGGMLPNVFYNLGTLSGNTTFAFASATDNTIENEWMFQFATPSTAPTITWPAAITGWAGGSAPTINASKTYQVSVINGLGVIMEF